MLHLQHRPRTSGRSDPSSGLIVSTERQRAPQSAAHITILENASRTPKLARQQLRSPPTDTRAVLLTQNGDHFPNLQPYTKIRYLGSALRQKPTSRQPQQQFVGDIILRQLLGPTQSPQKRLPTYWQRFSNKNERGVPLHEPAAVSARSQALRLHRFGPAFASTNSSAAERQKQTRERSSTPSTLSATAVTFIRAPSAGSSSHQPTKNAPAKTKAAHPTPSSNSTSSKSFVGDEGKCIF